MSQDDPYSAVAAPAQDSDPYAGIAAPATTRKWSTKGPKGAVVEFEAPADADDATVRALAVKAVGDKRYLQSTVERPDTPAEAPSNPDGMTLADLVAGKRRAPTTGEEITRGLGLGTRGVLTGIGGLIDIPAGAINSLINLTGTNLSTTPMRDIGRGISNYIGLPSPETPTEQTMNAVNEGGASTLLPMGVASSLVSKGINAAAPFASRTIAQLAGGGAAGGASDTVRQSGGGVVPQLAAGIVAGSLPFAGSTAATNTARTIAELATPTAARVSSYAPKTGTILLKKLADQGQTPEVAASMLDAARGRGVPLALMDIGDETRGLASSLSRKPGPSRTIIRDQVIPRQSEQGDRITGAINRDLGPTVNIRQQSEELIAGARQAAAPLYARAYATPVPTTPELNSVLATPFGRQALARARAIAANERRAPEELGFALDADGNVTLNPHPNAEAARLLSARSQLDEAQQSLRELRNTPGADAAASRGKVEAARSDLREAQAAIARAPDPGSAASVPTYTTQTLDYVKRGMDDVIEAMRDPVTGRLNLDEAGRAMNGVRASFIKEVDKLNPSYGEARKAYAGPASMASALAKGAKIATRDADTISAEIANLSAPEIEQYKLGVRTALVKMLEGRTDASDKVRALLGTPRKRAALAQLFGGEDKFEVLLDTLADESAAAQTYARVNAGSQTAANLADDAALDGIGGVAANSAARAIGGQGMVRNAVSTIGDLYRYGAGKSGERVRTELAAGISETDPVALQKALDAATRVRKGLEVRKSTRRAAIGSSTVAAGSRDR